MLARPDAEMLNPELLVFHACELMSGRLAEMKAQTAQEQAKTITVKALN